MLCIYTVSAATRKVLVFAKQRGGSKAREIQRVARSSMLEEASKLLRDGKNLD